MRLQVRTQEQTQHLLLKLRCQARHVAAISIVAHAAAFRYLLYVIQALAKILAAIHKAYCKTNHTWAEHVRQGPTHQQLISHQMIRESLCGGRGPGSADKALHDELLHCWVDVGKAPAPEDLHPHSVQERPLQSVPAVNFASPAVTGNEGPGDVATSVGHRGNRGADRHCESSHAQLHAAM